MCIESEFGELLRPAEFAATIIFLLFHFDPIGRVRAHSDEQFLFAKFGSTKKNMSV